MKKILGKEVTVVDRPRAGYFGLPNSLTEPNSGQPVWYYPFSVIEGVQLSSNTQGIKAEAEAKPATVVR